MIIPANLHLAKLPYLRTFLPDQSDVVIGWGRKPSGRRAEWMARILGYRLALMEDGFVRSFEREAPSLSLIIDDLGVYYDARSTSRMELIIVAGTSETQAERARRLVAAWRTGGISKYNHAPDYGGLLPERYVLVVDQTNGDLSVMGGLADETRFTAMLNSALTENPNHEILVKIHPDVLTHRKRGNFALSALQHPRIRLIADGCHPVRLLRHATCVYTVTSLLGFEALLWAKPVRCFGMPFYAGWGLTHDDLSPPARRGPARLEDVVYAAFVAQARYANPDDGAPWQAEQAITYMARKRAARFGPNTASP